MVWEVGVYIWEKWGNFEVRSPFGAQRPTDRQEILVGGELICLV